MRFHKYHALGNDYIVLNPSDFPNWKPAPTVEQIRVVCHRNFGVGSDGILWGPLPSKQSEFGLRIFNPRPRSQVMVSGSSPAFSGIRGS